MLVQSCPRQKTLGSPKLMASVPGPHETALTWKQDPTIPWECIDCCNGPHVARKQRHFSLVFDQTIRAIIFAPSRTYPHEGSLSDIRQNRIILREDTCKCISSGSQVVSNKDPVFTCLQAMPKISQKKWFEAFPVLDVPRWPTFPYIAVQIWTSSLNLASKVSQISQTKHSSSTDREVGGKNEPLDKECHKKLLLNKKRIE